MGCKFPWIKAISSIGYQLSINYVGCKYVCCCLAPTQPICWALTMWDVNKNPKFPLCLISPCWALTMWDVNYNFMYGLISALEVEH